MPQPNFCSFPPDRLVINWDIYPSALIALDDANDIRPAQVVATSSLFRHVRLAATGEWVFVRRGRPDRVVSMNEMLTELAAGQVPEFVPDPRERRSLARAAERLARRVPELAFVPRRPTLSEGAPQ